MIQKLGLVAALPLLLLASLPVRAAEQTVALDVRHAECALCGPIVKSTLERVKGVSTVTVSQADDMANVKAVVTFNDSVTSVPALIAATTNAGYPASVVQ